jgi:hypothetical protein
MDLGELGRSLSQPTFGHRRSASLFEAMGGTGSRQKTSPTTTDLREDLLGRPWSDFLDRCWRRL